MTRVTGPVPPSTPILSLMPPTTLGVGEGGAPDPGELLINCPSSVKRKVKQGGSVLPML